MSFFFFLRYLLSLFLDEDSFEDLEPAFDVVEAGDPDLV
jgi:hypothetical protein